MSRAAIVYLVMIVALVSGLWAVLEIGGKLTVPEDLAGKWQLVPMGHTLEGAAVTVEQSGKFFQVSFEHGPHLDLKLHDQSPTRMVLKNASSQMIIDGPTGGDDKSIQLTGDQAGQWTAHRIVRTFAADVSAKEGH